MIIRKIKSAAAGVILVALISGCTSSGQNRNIDLVPVAGDSAQAPPVSLPYDQYYIAPGDNVEVKFPYSPDFSDQYTVQPDGYISLAFIGSVLAAGKTSQQLQAEVHQQYRDLANAERGSSAVEKTYRIQIGDELEIKFPYQAEFDELALVRPDGRISLALIGSVIAEEKSPEQLTAELMDAYRVHLREPELVVIVREFSSNRYYINGEEKFARLSNLNDSVVVLRSTTPMQIFVGGEVRSPGFFPYTGPISAIQAIIMAGGNTLSGEMANVAIIRKGRGEQGSIYLRNLRQDVAENSEGSMALESAALGDVMLQPNDVVIIPKTTIAKVNDYLNQYLYNLIPALRNSSFGFVYNLRDNENFGSVITVPSP